MRVRTLAGAAGVAVAAVLAVTPVASAQGQQNGLVNVAVGNVVLQVPIGVAANVCGLDVAIVRAQSANGPVACNADVNQFPVAFRTPVG